MFKIASECHKGAATGSGRVAKQNDKTSSCCTTKAGRGQSDMWRVLNQVGVWSLCQVTSGHSRKVGKHVIECDNQMMRKSGSRAVDERGMTLYVLED